MSYIFVTRYLRCVICLKQYKNLQFTITIHQRNHCTKPHKQGRWIFTSLSAQRSAQRRRAGRTARSIKWRHRVMSTGNVRHLEPRNHGLLPLALIPCVSARFHSTLVRTVHRDRPPELEDTPYRRPETEARMAGKRPRGGFVLVGGGAQRRRGLNIKPDPFKWHLSKPLYSSLL